MIHIPVSRLHELFFLDHETGHLICRSRRSHIRAGERAGSLKSDGYRRVRIDGRMLLEHRVIYAMVNGDWPDLQIDHINCIRDDNRPANLRKATQSQNLANAIAHSHNKTGLKGVSFHKASGKFRSQIKVSGVVRHLGCFNSADEAHGAYANAARELHGNFSRSK